ncbi:MAG: 3-isopropylmalate dehydratase large subunit [Desulfobacterales bacterium GWB2_56_26]|nr:MAG: 3-isopropylmalate dehydratase large subunit [Desulfobacterales bacterium GWB2_56_26]
MNVIEKILAAHCSNGSQGHVRPGMIVEIAPDLTMANDATAVLAIDVFKHKLQAENVHDPARVVFIMDHYTPSCSIDAADTHQAMRAFAREQQLPFVYDGIGVCHQLMMERHVRPGQLIIGADSHTCNYGALGALSTGMGSTDVAVAWRTGRSWMKVPEAIRIEVSGAWPAGVCAKDLILRIVGDLTTSGATYQAMVFAGPAIRALGISERMTLCNMVIEAGAKFSYIQPDDKTAAFLRAAGRPDYPVFDDDADAVYARTLTYDVGSLEPQIACPGSVDNVHPIGAAEGIAIDEFFLGACTNGRYEDLEIAAQILRGKEVAAGSRLLVTPASRDVLLSAMASGVLATLIESGAMIANPGCSACFGGTGGILGKNEKLLTTANRNFKGRVGSPDSEIFLASPAVVAASAITGRITDPRRILQ